MSASQFLHLLFALSFATQVVLHNNVNQSADQSSTIREQDETDAERKLKGSGNAPLRSAVLTQDQAESKTDVKNTTRGKIEKASALLQRLSDVVDSMAGKDEKEPSDDAQSNQIKLPKFSADMLKRQARIESCLQNYYTKPVNADVLRPWSIMHGVLAFGNQSMVATRGKRVNAVDYLCHNGIGNDRRLFQLNSDKISVVVGTGYQGHEGQLLAILAQVKTPIDHPIQIDGQSFTVKDLVEYEKSTCRVGKELTFKLIGLSVYLPSDTVWQDSNGQSWDISRLMYEELAQPINGAACGGVHRLMGLSYAIAVRQARGEPIDGQWKRAANFIANYQKHALTLQNADGGFSTEFFEGLSNSPDPIRQIYTTGHLLEWLAFSMTEEELKSTPMLRMVDRLLELMEAEYRPNQELNGTDVGPKGHALRALRLYELRIFGESSDHQQLASSDTRQIIKASEVSALQQNIRVVLPTTAASTDRFHTNSPSSNSSNESGNMRNSRFMRRR